MPYKDPAKQRAYNKKYMRAIRKDPKYRAKERVWVNRNTRLYRAKVRALITEFKKGGCALCPEREPCCMSAHHRNPKQKDFSVGTATAQGFSLERVALELKKCVCLCENCHRKVHAKILYLPGRAELVTPAVPHTA